MARLCCGRSAAAILNSVQCPAPLGACGAPLHLAGCARSSWYHLCGRLYIYILRCADLGLGFVRGQLSAVWHRRTPHCAACIACCMHAQPCSRPVSWPGGPRCDPWRVPEILTKLCRLRRWRVLHPVVHRSQESHHPPLNLSSRPLKIASPLYSSVSLQGSPRPQTLNKMLRSSWLRAGQGRVRPPFCQDST
jgi:hypothetical protein